MFGADLTNEPFESLLPPPGQKLSSISSSSSLRCAPALASFIKKSQLVDKIYYSRKHIAVLHSNSQRITLFDTVPQWAHPEPKEVLELANSIENGQKKPITGMLSSTLNSKVSQIQVIQSERQQELLLAIQEDGLILSWEWKRENWKWMSCGSAMLKPTQQFNDPKTVRLIERSTISTNNRIYWIETIIEDDMAFNFQDDPRSISRGLFCSEFKLNSFSNNTPNLRATPVHLSPHNLEVTQGNILAAFMTVVTNLLNAPNHGIWIVFEGKKSKTRNSNFEVSFYSSLTGKIYNVRLPSTHTILHYVQHHITLEIVLLDDMGNIYVTRPSRNDETVQVTKLSQIYLDPSLEPIQTLQIHQHALVLTRSTSWEVFDARSGAKLRVLDLPSETASNSNLWASLSIRDVNIGFWTAKGLWRLKAVPVTEYCKALAVVKPSDVIPVDKNIIETTNGSIQTKDSSLSSEQPLSNEQSSTRITPAMSASLVSRDWSLSRWESKYLLDIVTSYNWIENPTELDTLDFISACDKLLPHLQSPIILLSILEEAKFSRYAAKMVKQFIDACLARSTDSTTRTLVSQNEVHSKAFQLFTSFNGETIPLLKKFLEISTSESLNNRSSHDRTLHDSTGEADLSSSSNNETNQRLDDITRSVQALNPIDCAKLDLNSFQLYLNNCPIAFLEKLETFSGLSSPLLDALAGPLLSALKEKPEVSGAAPYKFYAPELPVNVNTLLLREEEKSSQPDYLDVLCLLYYQHKPQAILPLIDILLRREELAEGRSLIPRRALLALPPYEGSTQEGGDENKFRLWAHLGLMDRAYRSTSALRLLLRIYGATQEDKYWKWALALVDSKTTAKQAKTRIELTTALLTYSLDPSNRLASPACVSEIWKRMAPHVSPMDLVSSIRQEIDRVQSRHTPPVMVEDETTNMSVGTLRAQLLKLGVH